MGELISLQERRSARAPGGGHASVARAARATFYFDLALPGTYLASERVDRLFPEVRWQPVCAETVRGGSLCADEAVAEAEERALALSIPMVWPDPFPADVRPAMRAAALACALGRGAAYVLAASRLAFCGGFDLSDPEVLAEVAAAASIPLDDCLQAAGDRARDAEIETAGRRLLAAGADGLPAIRIGRLLFCGEERLSEAVAAAHGAGSPGRARPSAPAGASTSA